MTVQQLIDSLNTIEDKTQCVLIQESSPDDEWYDVYQIVECEEDEEDNIPINGVYIS